MDSFDSQTVYPRSFCKADEINRSRTYNENISSFWNVPVTGQESLEERAQKYLLFFKLTPDQVRYIHEKLSEEFSYALNIHKKSNSLTEKKRICSIRLLDTFLTERPDFSRIINQNLVSLHFHDTLASNACVSVIKLDEKRPTMKIVKFKSDLQQSLNDLPKGLLDRKTPAMMLFDKLSNLVGQALKFLKADQSSTTPISISMGFPLEQRSLSEAQLLHWTREFETGRETNDPAERVDINALMDQALVRANLNAKVASIVNDAVATFLSASYEKPPKMPQIGVGITVGHGFNASFYLPDSQNTYDFRSGLISCDLGGFDKDLPVNDVDVEVDFNDESTEGFQIFEKMVALNYLEELCRRVVVKVWQSEAPKLAWIHHSMPWMACLSIVDPQNESTLDKTDEILRKLWDWETNIEQRNHVRQLFRAVFDRSAALCAIAIVVLSSQTGLLQPAMNGLVVAITGELFQKSVFFKQCLNKYIHSILPRELEPYITLYEVEDGIAKGAALSAKLASS